MRNSQILSLFILSLTIFSFSSCTTEVRHEIAETASKIQPEPVDLKYGFDLERWHTVEGKINAGDVLSKVLMPLGVGASELEMLIQRSEGIFDVRKIRPDQKWISLFRSDSASTPSFFIYEKNAKDYVVFSLEDSLSVWADSKPVELEERLVSGNITSSLYEALQDANAPAELALEMSSIYAWTIDFYRLQKDDSFELLFEEELVDGEPIGKQHIKAARFIHNGKERMAYFYQNDSIYGYFDEEGGSLRKAFLKAPVEFSRISSRYTKKRFHPVLKRYKSHLGTDYAAPHGTPIVAVGDGTVIKSGYTKGNGNYVKIRHNGTYETQYLHMSKRACKVGDFVTQGEVIGYVGSTGLATGPHVCFRFWKNGVQIDHLGEEFPPAEPIPADQMPHFRGEIDRLNLEMHRFNETPELVPSDSTLAL